MQMHTGVYWSAGPGRRKNQDSLCLQHVSLHRGECLLAVVCDGIGSLEHSEDAGGLVISRLTDWFYQEGKKLIFQKASKEQILLALQRQVFNIQELLRRLQQTEDIQTGTTCSGILIIRNRYYLIHIGDSRIYRIREKKIPFLKQSYQVKCLTMDDHDQKGHLAKALGLAGTDRAVFETGKLRKRTGFLVSTDGFYRKNTEAEIGRMLGGLLKTCIGQRKRGWPGQQLLSQQGTGRCGQQLERRLELLGKNGAMRGSRDDMAAIGILVE